MSQLMRITEAAEHVACKRVVSYGVFLLPPEDFAELVNEVRAFRVWDTSGWKYDDDMDEMTINMPFGPMLVIRAPR